MLTSLVIVIVVLAVVVRVESLLTAPKLSSTQRVFSRLWATAGNPGMQGGEESWKPEISSGGIVGSSKDSNAIPEEIRQENLPKLDGTLLRSLKNVVGELVMSKTVETTSRYMKEFRNDADQRWLCSWRNFNTKSFSGVFAGRDDSVWSDWLEAMIQTDKLEIQVLMNPPKLSKKATRARGEYGEDWGDETEADADGTLPPGVTSLDSGIRIEYMHDVEPRKIANQLLQVRESITKELQLDLPCIRLENIEAVRFAKTKVEMGEEEAIKTIKMTRSTTMGGDSTPLRDRTYHDFSVIITNFALQMARSSSDDATQAYLDNYLEELEKEEKERSVVERLFHEFAAPIELLEEMHVRGLQQGLISIEDREDSEKRVNILKLSQTILDCRYAVSLEVSKLLADDDNMTRQYYKMIKDMGGFKKFDIEGKGEIRIVDLNAKPGDELYPTARTNAPSMDLSSYGDGIVHEKDAEESMGNLLAETDVQGEKATKAIAVVKDAANDDEDGEFGGSGPFLM